MRRRLHLRVIEFLSLAVCTMHLVELPIFRQKIAVLLLSVCGLCDAYLCRISGNFMLQIIFTGPIRVIMKWHDHLGIYLMQLSVACVLFHQ